MTDDFPTFHLRRLHGTKPYINWDRLPVIQHKISFHQDISKLQCPLPGCPVLSLSISGLRNHLNRMHWQDSIHIFEEHLTPYPQCDRCGCQVPPWQLNNRHCNTDQCRLRRERRRRKAQRRLFMVAEFLVKVVTTVQAGEVFYNTVVQAVLMYKNRYGSSQMRLWRFCKGPITALIEELQVKWHASQGGGSGLVPREVGTIFGGTVSNSGVRQTVIG